MLILLLQLSTLTSKHSATCTTASNPLLNGFIFLDVAVSEVALNEALKASWN